MLHNLDAPCATALDWLLNTSKQSYLLDPTPHLKTILKLGETMKNIPAEVKALVKMGCAVLLVVLAVIFLCISGISWLFLFIWKTVAVAKFAAPVLTYWNIFGIVTAIWFVGGLLFGNNNKKSS
jgi:hypothetical protein